MIPRFVSGPASPDCQTAAGTLELSRRDLRLLRSPQPAPEGHLPAKRRDCSPESAGRRGALTACAGRGRGAGKRGPQPDRGGGSAPGRGTRPSPRDPAAHRRRPGGPAARAMGRAPRPVHGRARAARPDDHRLDADGPPASGGRLSNVPPDAAPRTLPPPGRPVAQACRLLPHRGVLQAGVEPLSSARGRPRDFFTEEEL